MKNVARVATVVSVSLTLAAALGAVACWPLAPSGGSLPDDASTSGGGGDGTTSTTDSSVLADGQTSDGGDAGDGGGDAGDGGDAADAAPTPSPTATIGAGMGFGCYIDAQGSVWCWGNNTYGQAGTTPSSTVVTTPQHVSGIVGAKALALGDNHACAVTTSGAVSCWGLNASYQLGHAPLTMGDSICPGNAAGQTVACTGTPVAVTLTSAASSIQAAGAWTCTGGTDGTVQCWGAVQDMTPDASVPCGVGNAPQGGSCYAAPYAVGGVSGVTQLAVAFDHACAIVDGGPLSCWGFNNEGQVSPSGCVNNDCAPTTVNITPASAGIGLGFESTCALGTDGTVRCFGDNAYGQLGHVPGTSGDNDPDAGVGVFNLTPTAITTLGSVETLVGTTYAACALVGTTVYCWGEILSDAGPGIPVAIGGLPAMGALGSIDSTYACGIATDGSFWCWDLVAGGATQIQ